MNNNTSFPPLSRKYSAMVSPVRPTLGKITQIIGAVLDIKFPEGNLPEINEAIKINTKDGGVLVVEIAQHLPCRHPPLPLLLLLLPEEVLKEWVYG